MTQDWPVVIVGIGNLGHALANYSGFRSRGFRVVALLDADPARHGEVVAGHRRAPLRRPRADRGRARRGHRRDRHARRRRPGRRRPDGRVRDHQHPQLRADRARGARRGRRAQGRPLHRAADPRLPRAAQGPGRGDAHERPGRGHLPQVRAGRAARAGRPRRRRRPQAGRTTSRPASTSPRRPSSRPATGSRSTPTSTASTAASRRSRGCSSSGPARPPRRCCPHLYVHYDDGAVSHLFQVAAGLDSMAVGEGQILGQTRDALRLGPGARHRRPGPQRALPAGPAGRQALPRRDRHRPRRPSLVSAALDRAGAAVGDVAGKRVLVRRGRRDGRPGHRDRLAPRRRRGRRRQPHAGRADRLADEYAARAAAAGRPARPSWPRADVVVSCTGATGVLVTARAGRPPRRPTAAGSRHRPGAARTTSTPRSPSCPASP